jgi:hypothetical protein
MDEGSGVACRFLRIDGWLACNASDGASPYHGPDLPRLRRSFALPAPALIKLSHR